MAEMTLQQAFSLAIQHHQSGHLPKAESIYQQIVAIQPGHADALHMLGLIRRQTGDNAAAVELIRRAIAADPACRDANFNLGNALRDHAQIDQAIAAYRQSIALGQNVQQSHQNLGCLLRDKGHTTEAAAAFELAEQAAAAPKKTAPRSSDEIRQMAMQWFSRGDALRLQRNFAEAITAFQRAVAIDSGFAEAYCNLGNALVEEKQLHAAITAYRQAIALNPNLPMVFHNLGKTYYDLDELDQAIAANRQALVLLPDYASAGRNLASNLFETGLLDEAIATYRNARGNDAGANARTDSGLIYTLLFHPASTAQSIAEETRRWNQLYALPLTSAPAHHPNGLDPQRRLRIGHVSADFRHHVVGQNLAPLFDRHDHGQFEIVCYSDVPTADESTHWFQQHADLWRNTVDLSDPQLAQQIREDQIDILVDLALHTGNRLGVFARKPAPVQVTFAGYPGTTGLTAIDYRLSDRYLDPPEMDESVFSEATIRLPHSFWCFDPQDCRDIPVNPLPADVNGFITFGCLNNFCKINTLMLDRWAQIMQKVEHSRLILLAKFGKHRQRTIDYLGHHGIAAERIEFVPIGYRRDYLRQFHRIDISLDTFPYNGHTTSLDSLWMGVPIVTLVGSTSVARAGWCQLSNLGLTDLTAKTADEFIEIAATLARDIPKLQQLRSSLRARMVQSPLMNAGLFAQNIEAAYRKMWSQHCNEKNEPLMGHG